MIGKAQYDYFYNFRVGDVPNISASDRDWKYDYSVVKIGSAFKFGSFSFGGFVINQKADATLDYTFYNPSDGAVGSTENHPFSASLKGFGAGVSY